MRYFNMYFFLWTAKQTAVFFWKAKGEKQRDML